MVGNIHRAEYRRGENCIESSRGLQRVPHLTDLHLSSEQCICVKILLEAGERNA